MVRINKKDNKINLNSIKNKNCFFGYYDRKPNNISKSKILYHQLDGEISKNNLKKKINLFYKDLFTRENTKFAESSTWNYQQGTLMQWLTDTEIIYNDFINNVSVTCLYDTFSKKSRILKNKNYYSLSNDKKKIIYYNFSRISKFRPGYGYQAYNNDNDEVFSVFDLSNNNLLFSCNSEMIKKFFDIKDDKFWLDHFIFSPDSKKISFYIRIPLDIGFKTKMVIYDLSKKKMYSILDNNFAGHYCWVDKANICVWTRDSNISKQIYSNPLLSPIKKLYFIYRKLFNLPNFVRKSLNEGFFYIDTVTSAKKKMFEEINSNYGAGHFTIKNNLLISDTFFIENYKRILFVYDFVNKNFIFKLKLKSNSDENSTIRCDLHPRVDNCILYVDSDHEGFRGLYNIKYL